MILVNGKSVTNGESQNTATDEIFKSLIKATVGSSHIVVANFLESKAETEELCAESKKLNSKNICESSGSFHKTATCYDFSDS